MNRTALLVYTVFCIAGILHADRLDGLVKRSPFAPDKNAGINAAPAIAPSRVEFGGYMVVDGKPLVSLCDTVTGQSVWVGLKDAAGAYFVESLDAATPAVQIRLNGVTTSLGLRKVSSDGPMLAAASPGAVATIATVNDPGAASDARGESAIKDKAPTNRIPPTKLRIPPRVDDPPVNAAN